MRHLQTFSIFESTGSLTPDQTFFLDKFVRGTWTLNSKGKIDVEGDFLAHREDLTDFMSLKFGRVTGDFRCDGNRLTSLDGAPSTVGGEFHCDNNRLTSLKGGPTKVGGDFNCRNNLITSLEDGPGEVGGDYDCSPNDGLVSLKGAPEILKKSFEGPGGIYIPSGVWSIDRIFKTWKRWKKTEDPRGKALLATLLTKEKLQKEIDEDPAGALADFKNHFSEPWFRELDLKWPGKMGPWVDLMGDAGELGF
jgi:hypothetical protein